MNLKNTHRRIFILAGMMMLVLTNVGATATATPGETIAAYSEVTLRKGSITENVIATGSLRFEKEESMTLQEEATLKSIEIDVGESVSKGQILAHYDVDALNVSLKTAQEALFEQDEAIISLLSGQSSDQSVKTSIAGVVKKLNLLPGQPVQQSLQGQPAAIISVNGLMEVSIISTQPLNLGQEVKVKVGTLTQTGSVARLDADGSTVITFPDTKAEIDETVQVKLNTFAIGEGKAQVSLPYQMYTQLDGVVASSPVKVNSVVRRNSIIYQIKNVPPTAEYLQALSDREELVGKVLRYTELIADPVYVSDMDGIVGQVNAQEGVPLQKGDELLRLYVQDFYVLDVAVDELDILSVQEKQEGVATLDALTQAEFPVRVEKINLLGSTSSGITNYTVTLSIQGDERLRSGMNGTVTLTVGEVNDSVLVPLAALMSDRGGNYVLLKGNEAGASAQAEGIKTYVEVGLSDANYAAVLGGLNEGDIILVRSNALTNTQQTRQNMPNFMNPGTQFNPGGGQRR